MQDPLGQKIYELFHPHAAERTAKVDRLAYYTRAETALNIIQNETLWMRKTTCMNDFRELTFGLECITDQLAFKKSSLVQALDSTFPGLAEEVIRDFHQNSIDMMDDTYIACVSEHDASEDAFGRLSMWRAYGGATGIALVFKKDAVNLQGLPYYASPVLYADAEIFGREFDRVMAGLASSSGLLGSLSREFARRALVFAFQSALASIKHLGFKEEREWRIIYNPKVQSRDGMEPVIKTVNGVPQMIYQIALKKTQSRAGLLDYLDRLIVGPTQYPNEIAEALKAALSEKGAGTVPIVVSEIPLRHNA